MAGVEKEQPQSRLCTLPTELRLNILSCALLADDDHSKPYRIDRKYYRPGYEYHRKIDVAVLLACKQIYREARLLPISVNEHTFWLFGGPWKFLGRNNFNTAQWMKWYEKFTDDQKLAVQRVHVSF
jgi:hypothetical protein